jgi:hypothetical protein
MLENFAAGEGALQYGQEDFDEFASTAALAENWAARLIEATDVED